MTTQRSSRKGALSALAVFAAIAGGAFVAHDARAQEAPKKDPKKEEPRITFTAQGMNVRAFLKILSEQGGFTILDEAGVEGEITAIAQKKLTRDEALDVLRAWLLPKQRTAVRTGDVVRLMTLEDAKKRGSLPVKIGFDPESVPDNDEIVTQVVPLKRLKADDVRRELIGLISADGKLYVEPGSNSIVITDTQAVIRRTLLVLQPLDRSPELELRVRVFRLTNANADDVAKIIQDLFPKSAGRAQGGPQQQGGGRGGRGGGGNPMQQMQRMFFGGGGPGGAGAGATGAEIAEVNVSVDKRANSVIVAATQEQLTVIEPLIQEVDKSPVAVSTDLKAFRLANANPVDIATILEDIFAPTKTQNQQQAQGGRGGNLPAFMRQVIGQQQQDNDPSTGPYAPDPRFTVDARTNSLIVSAVPSQMKLIESLVKDLDHDSTFRQSILVVPLKNADAANVAQVVASLLQSAGTTTQTQQRGNAANTQVRGALTTALAELSGDVKVVADKDSNALVVTTSPKNFSRIKAIIDDLDRPRRQVLIETLIAEVTLDSKGELGVQWSTNWIRGVDGQKGGTSTAASDLGLGALASGFRYTSISDRVTMTIRALQTDGRLNVLSSPKVLTLENQAAEISVGREVPFITNSRITQNGDTVNTVQYRNVGIILKVTPHLNEAGDVRMIVHPEVSEIGPESQGVVISNGVKSPVFERNYADTTISVRDGETAILGGLIRNELTETVEKMPILGDIPLLGLAFRSKTTAKKKVELIVLMTPHVIESAEQLRKRTRQTQDKFVLVPPEVLKDELDRWTKGLEEKSAVAYYNRGTVYMEAGRLVEAVDELERARDIAPRDAATRFNLGLAYAKVGDIDKAESEFRAAGELDPRDAEVHYNLGAVLWRRGEFQGAERELRAAIELDPQHSDAKHWLERVQAALKSPPAPHLDAPKPEGGDK